MKIVNVGPSSTVLVGNTGVIDLNSSTKTYSGANSFNTGDNIGTNIANNQANSLNTIDPDLIDSANA
ncbi:MULTISPECIES: spore germination protein [Paenibacillus]